MTFYLSMTIKSLLVWILIILILIAIAFVVGFCIGSDGPDEKDEKEKTIKDFAEWLVKNMFNGCNEFWKGNTPHDKPMHIEDFISEYEKEQAKGGEND